MTRTKFSKVINHHIFVRASSSFVWLMCSFSTVCIRHDLNLFLTCSFYLLPYHNGGNGRINHGNNPNSRDNIVCHFSFFGDIGIQLAVNQGRKDKGNGTSQQTSHETNHFIQRIHRGSSHNGQEYH